MIVVVGIAPGRGGTIRHLAGLLGLEPNALTSNICWVNLWPHGETGSDESLYVRLVEQGTRPGDLIVLLGREVAAAFALAHLEPLGTVERNAGAGPTILALPHPSGRNLWWNDPDHVAAATETLQRHWLRASR